MKWVADREMRHRIPFLRGSNSFRDAFLLVVIRDDFQNAERFLRISARQLPDNALVQNNIAVLYRETNRPLLALKHFQRAHELEPSDETIRRNLDRLQEGLQKKQD